MLLTEAPSYFKRRRDALIQKHPGGVFLLPALPEFLRGIDNTYPYRQESNLQYLTGFEEPESFAVIRANPKAPGSELILFVREKNVERELWEGKRYGTEGARKVFGADQAYLISEFSSKLPELLKGAEEVYYRVGLQGRDDQLVFHAMDRFRASQGRSGKGLLPLKDAGAPIAEQRLFKAPEEADFMRLAGQISAKAHTEAMKAVRPGMNEYEIQALLEFVYMKNGCRRVAYEPIVASGEAACCLHYRYNQQDMKDGTLLLIDSAGEYQYYNADITRTFPVGKHFSKPQKAIYEIVLKAQKEVVAMVKPGVPYAKMHEHATEILAEGLISLGLLQGTPKSVIEDGSIKRFYPHGTGHWLGMDVHDVGLYRIDDEPRKLEPGMCFTVEPGLYCQPDDLQCPEEFRGIGVRIEDDILVTRTGCENLTESTPKELDEIEAIRAQAY